jgi:CHAT domain-containing protein
MAGMPRPEGDEALHPHFLQLATMPHGHRPFEHPFYWGAFICQGDTAPLATG